MKQPKVNKKELELQSQIEDLTADLQRLRADFENYHRRVEADKTTLSELTKAATIIKLLPVIDTIERAIAHAPAEFAGNAWVEGVTSLGKNLEKALGELGLTRIPAAPGTVFDPTRHEAVAMDDAEGAIEVVAEELRAGYLLGAQVVRPSMVRVTKVADASVLPD